MTISTTSQSQATPGWNTLLAQLVPAGASATQCADALDAFAAKLERSSAPALSGTLAALVDAETPAEGARRIRACAQIVRATGSALGSMQADPGAATETKFTNVGGRVWSELTRIERHNLFVDAPDTYAQLRAENEQRATEQHERGLLFAEGRRAGKLTAELERHWAGRPVACLREWLPVAPAVREVAA